MAPTLYTLAADSGSATGIGVIEAPSGPGRLRPHMRFGLVSRNNLTLIALFALAFGGVLVYVSASSRAQDVAQTLADQPAAPVAEVEPPHHGADLSVGTTNAAPDVRTEAAAAAVVPTDPPLNDQQQQNLTRWSNQIISAHVPEARADAIRELASVKNQEAVRALAYALSSDDEPSNRLAAVASLNSLAKDGYEVGAIRDTLRLAAADADPGVADHAKDAYDQLMRDDEAK